VFALRKQNAEQDTDDGVPGTYIAHEQTMKYGMLRANSKEAIQEIGFLIPV
jgi:hypothetical protein